MPVTNVQSETLDDIKFTSQTDNEPHKSSQNVNVLGDLQTSLEYC